MQSLRLIKIWVGEVDGNFEMDFAFYISKIRVGGCFEKHRPFWTNIGILESLAIAHQQYKNELIKNVGILYRVDVLLLKKSVF